MLRSNGMLYNVMVCNRKYKYFSKQIWILCVFIQYDYDGVHMKIEVGSDRRRGLVIFQT